MKKGKILIVEDDNKIVKVLKRYLEEEYFDVLILKSGNKVVDKLKSSSLDLILLDIMLPDQDGMTICREIRSFSNVPIIFITAKVDPFDRMLGLEIGADDYICKPFIPKEVVARVKAVIRRTRPDNKGKKLVLDPIIFDEKSHRVTVGGSNIILTPIEYELLRIMMSKPEQIFTRDDLISKIHGHTYECYDRTIDNHIKNLRKKINLHLQGREMIHTIYGFGYKISSPNID